MVFKFIEKIYIHVNKYDTHQLWIILSLILFRSPNVLTMAKPIQLPQSNSKSLSTDDLDD